ncbi:MAG: methyltransferase domain-containing protein [Candidatus Rokubacteria bacterium]|nr:methyltransferase domain-containing protein [Candidatus Rokubacteria bacterium]
MTHQCRVCGGRDLRPVIDLGMQPIAHRFLEPGASGDEFRHRLALHACAACGLAQIVDPIPPAVLYGDYNYCFSAWKPQPHTGDEIATILDNLGDPRARAVFEVACNDGTFLNTLRDSGFGAVVGLEPNPVASEIARSKGFTVYGRMIDEAVCREAVRRHGRFDLVVARQVVEHLCDLPAFFRCVDILLKDDGRLFVDVPDFDVALATADCSAVWEEHVNYFTEPVLSHAFTRFGYRPLLLKRYDFSGGALAILAERAAAVAETPKLADDVWARILTFDRRVRSYAELLRSTLERHRARGARIVLYGVGCRACTVVNGLELGPLIDFAIDDQPERQGKRMAGSRLEIRAPRMVGERVTPVLCLLAVNAENEDAVKARLKPLAPGPLTFASLLSPNDVRAEIERIR